MPTVTFTEEEFQTVLDALTLAMGIAEMQGIEDAQVAYAKAFLAAAGGDFDRANALARMRIDRALLRDHKPE
jgi:hypothetical protein